MQQQKEFAPTKFRKVIVKRDVLVKGAKEIDCNVI